MTASSVDCHLATASPSAVLSLDGVATEPVRVLGIDGDDALSARLASAGIWPGVVIERITTAPLGDPLLFRVQGYRLALRRSEAARVRVTPCAETAE